VSTGVTRAEQGIRVAIVDDLPLVADALVAHLSEKSLGIRVVANESSWAGLLANAAFPPEVTVLDLHLDDGVSIGAKVRILLAAGSQVVAMSRHTNSGSIYGALHAGALGYVPKTERATELVSAIRAVATGHRHIAGEMASVFSRAERDRHPHLGHREKRALVLYARGFSIKAVAREMEMTEETVKSYI
jgi:two-component system uhpT operon response regulator UhpA